MSVRPVMQVLSRRQRIAKRAADIVIVSILAAPAFVLTVLLMVVVRLDSRGPAIFRQRRVGLGGKEYVIVKLRTLFTDRFGYFGDTELRRGDSRVTRVGQVLRELKLDEIPQLLNVLAGSMSLVGPRPDMPVQVASYGPREIGRLAVPPGMTGVAQVSGNTWLTWPQRIELDLWYIENQSLLLDLQIMWKTLRIVWRGERPDDDLLGIRARDGACVGFCQTGR